MARKRSRPERRSGQEKIRVNFTLHEENIRNVTVRPWIAPKDRSKTEYRKLGHLNRTLHTRYRRVFGVEEPLQKPGVELIGSTVDSRGKRTYWYRDRRRQKKVTFFMDNPRFQVWIEQAERRGIQVRSYGQLAADFNVPREQARSEFRKLGRGLGMKGNSLKIFTRNCLAQYDQHLAAMPR